MKKFLLWWLQWCIFSIALLIYSLPIIIFCKYVDSYFWELIFILFYVSSTVFWFISIICEDEKTN